MKTCPKMKTVIEELAQKHNIDLHEAGAHLRLDMPGYDRLCVENIGINRISVAHYFELNGDLVAEPDVVFLVDSDGSWKPIEVSQSLIGWRQYVMFSPDGKRITFINRAAQRDLAEFAEIWANNISEQGWLANGQLPIKTRRVAMEETKLLRKFVQELWVHKVQDARDVLRVQAPQGDELHVECTSEPFLVRLKYLVKEVSGELVKDLEVTFFVTAAGSWIPLEFHRQTAHHIYALVPDQGQELVPLDRVNQNACAAYCDAWSFHLREQGWIEKGVVL